MAEALYRKYRPQVFEDVVGQEPIERTLKNAIANDKVSHAYLFCGPRGTGKTTTARLLAKALLCQAGPTPDPDGTCDDCRLIADGAHPDVYELDAASRTGVDNVREEIISRVQFAPTRGRSKVYIVDEVHMLSTAAFNALLKTLEEPPSHVIFVLCTTDPQKVPETIQSRCQRFDFRRIAPESMVSRLGAICMAEGVEFEGEALDLIAHRAEGGLRNALTSLEQIIAFESGKVTLAGAERLLGSIDSNDMAEIISYVGRRDVANCFRWTAAYVETGADLAQFVRDMSEHVRNLYVLALVGDDADLDINETTRRQLGGELQWFGPDRLARLMGVLGDLSTELKTSSNPRLAFEISLTRMVRPDSDLTLEALAERVEALESGYSAVAHVLPGTPVGEPFAQPMPTQAPSPAPEPAQPAPIQQPEASQPAYTQRADRASAVQTAQAAAPQASAVQQESREAVADLREAMPEPVQPAPASAPAAAGASMLQNPAALQRVWQATLSALKRQKQAYGVLFMNTKVRYDEGAGTVRIVFPEEATFAFNAVRKPEVQEALAGALAHAVGGQTPFQFEKAGEHAASQAAAPARTQNQASPTAAAIEARPQAFGAAGQGRASAFDRGPTPSQGAGAPQGFTAPQGAAMPAPDRQAPRASAPEPAYSEAAPYEEVPYDYVPYDDAPYEPVPYEQYEDFASPSPQAPVQGGGPAQRETPVRQMTQQANAGQAPDAGQADDPASIQALLQEGFGGGVVFSEVQD